MLTRRRLVTITYPLTLITGGTGKTGRRVAERLVAAGHPVRVGSRSASPAFDWEDRTTWGAALDGVGAVYISYQPDICVPAALETIQAFLAQALDKGVQKFVLLSGRGEPEAEAAEQALKETGADWTILRASWFMQNFSEGHFLDPILGGELALPVGDVPEPFIDVEDIADAAAAALTGPGHSRRLYDMTGPQALTFAEAMDEIARASDRRIAFTRIPAPAYRAALEEAQVPEEVTDLILYLLTTVLDGRNVETTDGVMQALGRPARSFAGYARRVAATGVWSGVDA